MSKQSSETKKEKARDYYHKNKDKINAQRKKDRRNGKKTKAQKLTPKRKKQIKKARKKYDTNRKKHNVRNTRNRSKRHFGIKIHCPVHKQQLLYKLIYNTTVTKRKTKTNKRGLVGTRGQTDWLYCPKCDLPRKAVLTVVE